MINIILIKIKLIKIKLKTLIWLFIRRTITFMFHKKTVPEKRFLVKRRPYFFYVKLLLMLDRDQRARGGPPQTSKMESFTA